MKSVNEIRSFLGKNVEVVLDEKVICKGTLLAFCDSGEFALRDDMGFMHYCWPLLDIRLTNES